MHWSWATSQHFFYCQHVSLLRRKLEHLWCKDKLVIVEQCNRVNKLILDSRMKFYAHVIEDNCSNQRVLFSTFEKLVHLKAVRRLPSHDNALNLANRFVDFFGNKVQAIRDNLSPSVDAYHHDVSCDCVLELNEFAPTNAKELSSLLRPVCKILYFGADTWGLNERLFRCSAACYYTNC